MAIKGQACTETICKNIDTAVELDLSGKPEAPETGAAGLTAVRAQ